MLSSGYGGSTSPVYDVETEEFTQGSGYLTYGTTVWSPDDTLISLNWGTWGHGSPPLAISPSLARLAAPDFSRYIDGSASVAFSLNGLMHNTKQGFLSPNGRYAAAIDDTGGGMIWDATTGTPIAMLSDAASVVWSPDETRIAVQRLDGSVWILEADGTIQDVLPTSAGVQAPGGTFFWSPDSQKLAHLHDGMIDLWQWND
jgi:hypothetical protein